MNEIIILKRIFPNNLTITNDNFILETVYGNLIFITNEYPEKTPTIELELKDKEKEEVLKAKILSYAQSLKQKNINYMIYTLVLYFYFMIEERGKNKCDDIHLVEVHEITDEMFFKWKNNRKKIVCDNEDKMTGKNYFLSIERRDLSKQEY